MYTPNYSKIKMRIDRKIRELEREIKDYPIGELQVSNMKGRFQYRCKLPGERAVYIRANDRDFAAQLAYKGYLERRLEDLKRERKALLMLEEIFAGRTDEAHKYLYENEGVRRLVDGHLPHPYSVPEEWSNRKSAHEAPRQEERTIKCFFGLFVRSKSELIIATVLHELGIPFLYEEPLTIGSKTYYPDFTIFLPATGEIIYWEHFGKMDDPRYISGCTIKLRDYALAGIVPNINLITTYETKVNPLDHEQVVHALAMFFPEAA